MENKPTPNSLVEQKKDTLTTQFLKSEFMSKMVKGLILTLPLVILLFAFSIIFNLILKIVYPISVILVPGAEEPGLGVNLLSLLILIAFFYFLGMSVSSVKGRFLVMKIERDYLIKIPLYSTLRELVRQFTGMNAMPMSEVVLADIFGTGVWMTGFVTETPTNDIFTIFVPTAPNPTNGNIYHVPRERLKFTEVSSELGMRTVVAMGVGSTAFFLDEDNEVNKSKEDVK